MSGDQYNVALTIFFVSYIVFEVPANETSISDITAIEALSEMSLYRYSTSRNLPVEIGQQIENRNLGTVSC